jgi:hypothetical protein
LEQWKIFSLKNLELMLSNGAQNTSWTHWTNSQKQTVKKMEESNTKSIEVISF